MIVPRRWVPKYVGFPASEVRLNIAARDSKPLSMITVSGLFERRTPEQRKAAARRSMLARMAAQFAGRQFAR